MTARFILSLDCEGKWGVADILNTDFHRDLCDERLTAAYRDIVSTLDEFAIPATFAFVGAFAQPVQKFAEIESGLRTLAVKAPNYLGPALADLQNGSRQGWHGDWAVDYVANAATSHEIALHGMSHVPWTDADDAFISTELVLWHTMSGPVRDSRTFVYPRNSIAHVDRLEAAGFRGYRDGRQASRLSSFLSEFNVWANADLDSVGSEGITVIPAGYFVNWQNGPRRLVPRSLSARRAAHILDTADRDNGVVHYWLHPENLASAPSTIQVLRDLLRIVADLRDGGRCTVQTQGAYCDNMRHAGRPPVAYL